jgi:hypothetical protein
MRLSLVSLPPFLLFIGSSMIAHDVLKDATKRSRVYHRIILGMSCFDIIGSICYFLGRWPMPPDGLEGFGLTGGIGTQQTVNE